MDQFTKDFGWASEEDQDTDHDFDDISLDSEASAAMGASSTTSINLPEKDSSKTEDRTIRDPLAILELFKEASESVNEEFRLLELEVKTIERNARMPQTTRIIKSAIKKASQLMLELRQDRTRQARRAMELEEALASLKVSPDKSEVAGTSGLQPDQQQEAHTEKDPGTSSTALPSKRMSTEDKDAAKIGPGPEEIRDLRVGLERMEVERKDDTFTKPAPLSKRKATSSTESSIAKRKPTVKQVIDLPPEARIVPPRKDSSAPTGKVDKGKRPASGKTVPTKMSKPTGAKTLEPKTQETWATVVKGRKVDLGEGTLPAATKPPFIKPKKKKKAELTAEERAKRELSKPWHMRTKPPAIEVIIKEGEDYGAVLRLVKSDPAMQGITVENIRRTRRETLLIEFSPDEKSPHIVTEEIRRILGEKCNVTYLEPRREVEIRDIDEVTEQAEVITAIEEALPEAKGRIVIKALKRGFAGMQAAIVSLPAKLAAELADKSRIIVGWVRCRTRILPRITQCYRCHRMGHLAGQCKEPIGPPTCRGCGKEGHLLRECKNEPSCIICKEAGRKDVDVKHIGGSRRCPAYLKRTTPKKNRQKA